MIVKRNIPTYSISWLSDKDGFCTGVIGEMYYPETIKELVQLCQSMWSNNRKFYVFGHTSNSYLKPSFSPEIVISTLKLSDYTVHADSIVAQCGAHLRRIAKDMVERGVSGYEGLIDIPGTIGAAVYGNAGAYGCETADIVESVEFLDKREGIVALSATELHFSRRSSILKDSQKEGFILSVKLSMKEGDKRLVQAKADEAHRDRINTQPGPQNNLGSCFVGGGKKWHYRLLCKVVRILLCLTKKPSNLEMNVMLIVLGHKQLIPYLHSMNRFIWKDQFAHEAFEDYVRLYRRLHKKTKLEIGIYE